MSDTIIMTTATYHIRHSRYFALLWREIWRDWWSIPLLLATALTVATCYDVWFGIVLLLVIFVIAPMLLFLAYYHFALRPECLYSVTLKSLLITDRGIDCIAYETQRHVLDWADVKRVAATPEAYLLYTGRYIFFYLPYEAFTTPAEQQCFHDKILSAICCKPNDEKPA